MIPEDAEMQNLHSKKTQLIKEIAHIDFEISEHIKNCKHEIIKQGMVDCAIAVCKKCGKHFGWWCDKSEKHYCEYDEKNPYDDCIYCHEPEERQ